MAKNTLASSDTDTDDLYVMHDPGGYVKIGRSAAPDKRRRGLQTEAGRRLTVLHVMKGQGWREWALLKRLEPFRSRGEWFFDTPEFRAALDESVKKIKAAMSSGKDERQRAIFRAWRVLEAAPPSETDENVRVPGILIEELSDAHDHAAAVRALARGSLDALNEDEMDAYLAAPTPLAFWRRHRGMTQAALAAELGVSQAFVAQIEGGHRLGDVRTYARMAKVLRLRMEDLVPDA